MLDGRRSPRGAADRHPRLTGRLHRRRQGRTTSRRSPRPARSSPTRPAAPASATTWAARRRRGLPDRLDAQLPRADGQPRRRDLHGLAVHGRGRRDRRPHRRPTEDRQLMTGDRRPRLGVRRLRRHRQHVPGLRDEATDRGGRPARLLRSAARLDRRSRRRRHRRSRARTSGSARAVPWRSCSSSSASPRWSPTSSTLCSCATASTSGCPLSPIPGVTELVNDGTRPARLPHRDDRTTDAIACSSAVHPLPEFVLEIIEQGGVLPKLLADGYIPTDPGQTRGSGQELSASSRATHRPVISTRKASP